MLSARPLPYRMDALEPWVSASSMSLHYQLYQRYVSRTLGYFRDKRLPVPPSLSHALDFAVAESNDLVLLHNVQQALNHEMFWSSMSPQGGGYPQGELASLLLERWGTYSAFVEEWVGAGVGLFGSGWVWLAVEPESGDLDVLAAPNSDQPWQMGGLLPLVVMDVWEHAFYLDYPLQKPEYIQAFLQHLINWRRAEQNLEEL